MIYEIGTDIESISRIKQSITRSKSFPAKVLTKNELEMLNACKTKKRKIEFLAGHWSAKEAFAKAYGTGFGSQLSMQDLEVSYEENGRPIFSKTPFEGRAKLSISHTRLYVTAVVILEK